MAKVGVKAVKLTGESGIEERREIFNELGSGLCHVVLTTPEFLFHNQENFEVLKKRIGFFVVDEAHHLQTASIHHRPIYRMIHKVLPKIGNPVALATTATANEEVAKEIVKQLNIDNTIIDPTVRSNLMLENKRKIKNKDSELINIIEEEKKTVIYTNSRKETGAIAERLRSKLPKFKDKIVFYHAGLKPNIREIVQDGFKEGIFTTIVATSAFGEGVNIPDINNLVLYHLPFSEVQYNQLCGRAGRDNKPANIYLTYGSKDASINDFILENICPKKGTLRKIFALMKKLGKNGSFIADYNSLIEECETNNIYGITEKVIASSLKVFRELGLIEIEKEEGTRIVKLLPSNKVNLEDSTLYKEAEIEKEVFSYFKETALNSDVSTLLDMFNQPIYPKDWVKEGD